MKNILLGTIATMTVILASTTTQCMAAKATALLKKGISALGTAVGIGLPTVPTLSNQIQGMHATYKNRAGAYPNAQNLSPEEESFYRQYVSSTRELKKIPNSLDGAFSIGNVIFVPESITYKDNTISWSKALALNDTEALQIFAGTAEHEEAHSKYYHSYMSNILNVTIPCIATGIFAKVFKNTFPLASSLQHYCGRAASKMIGGLGIVALDQNYLSPTITGYIQRKKELIADDNISPQHRNAMIAYYKLCSKNGYENFVKTTFPNITDEKEFAAKVEAIRNYNDNLSNSCHPSVAKRIERLRKNTKKA